MTDQESQDDELLALSSIYDDDTFYSSKDSGIPGGYFSACLELPEPFTITMYSKITGSDKCDYISHDVQYLPPIMLNFEFPVDYPTSSPPKFTLSCKWLSLEQLSKLCSELDSLWEENKGEVVLFLWTNLLQNETLEILDISSPLDLTHVCKHRRISQDVSGAISGKLTETGKPVETGANSGKPVETGANSGKPVETGANSGKLTETGANCCEQSKNLQYSLDSKLLGNDESVTGANSLNYRCSENSNLCDSSSKLQDFDSEKLGKKNSCDLSGSETTDERAIQDIASRAHLIPTILDFDKQKKQTVFEKTLFTCDVCFVEKYGSLCLQFHDCKHVFCVDCMRGFFEVQIKDGNVKALTCPHDKCESQALPSQVKRLVSDDLFQKYDRLLLQVSLDTMTDIVYCPRPACQAAVILDPGSNMGCCAACHYVFCTMCQLTYHGVSPCKVKRDQLKKLRDEYQSADSPGKEFLEKRYGKRAIQQAMEEVFSQEWLDEFSKQCPDCGTYIQKIDGCNKMTCIKCRGYFCWICNRLLSRSTPYDHYRNYNSPCFNRLFEGIDIDEELNHELGWEDDW